ncbi:unnamed protein product [Gongylonema pulchrum]|uniref:Tub domain-containing protein n=1 Tax=Gongylonema pulchrum TaxID=637853 RepID=A0A183E2I1_9BILA|nr:unnamed protein product [Gongylonema pulchrum]
MARPEQDSITSFDNYTLKNFACNEKNNDNDGDDDDDENDDIGTPLDDQCIYGKLILLGYNGTLESSNSYPNGRKHRSKMLLRKRLMGNGIKKARSSLVNVPPSQSQVRCTSSKFVIRVSSFFFLFLKNVQILEFWNRRWDFFDRIAIRFFVRYNGTLESSNSYPNGRKHRSKMLLRKRLMGNGIKKARSSLVNVPPSQSQVRCTSSKFVIRAVRDTSRHVVSFSYNRNHTVLVEYAPDPSKDMFQVGRSSEDQIDFTIVDTWLAAFADVSFPAGHTSFFLQLSHNIDL